MASKKVARVRSAEKTIGPPSKNDISRYSANHILKYPNRRLYCLVDSRYITLMDIYDRIKVGIPVRVIEKKTQTDITSRTLLQLLQELADAGQHKVKPGELRDMILRDMPRIAAAA